MAWPIAGIIEGFYGRPWSWDERAEVMRALRVRHLTHYVYAPKDDPLHRERWRDLYGTEMLDGFGRLVAEGTLKVGFGISPGLSINADGAEDRAALAAKIDQVLGVGVQLVVLALDDIPFGGGEQGAVHARLTTWLHEHLAGRAELILVPTEYVGMAPTPYLEELATGTPEAVPIAWTGRAVLNDSISAAEAIARTEAMNGRSPLVWDNFPVNDGIMGDRLHLGPLWGRDPELRSVCGGYLANPMVQPRASLLPLASVAAFACGEDPLAAWVEEAERRSWRIFAEACDGAVPQALVERAVDWLDDPAADREHVQPLRDWLGVAATCGAPGIEDEVGDWIAQVRAEARLGLDALKLVDMARRGDIRAGIDHAFGVSVVWAHLRRADKTVMGPRFGVQPILGQRADGTWTFEESSIMEDRNAIDALARAALSLFAAASQR